jgi:hypothetical protein
VRLEVDEVAVRAAAEEVVEPDLEEVRRGGVARDMSAELRMGAICPHHHCERVPAHDGGDALLELQVARKLRLLRERDGVLVGRIEDRRQRHASGACVVQEPAQEEGGALSSFRSHQGIEGFQPFARLDRIGVGRIDAPEGGGNDIGEIGHFRMVAVKARHGVSFIAED